MFFNRFIRQIKPYQVVSHKAWDSNNSFDVLKLDWNEATVPPSPNVKVKLNEFNEQGRMNWYPNVDNRELRELIAGYSNTSVENVEYFASSDALHEYIIRAYINPGDKITLIAPTYDNFRAAAESVGAEIDYFYLNPNHGFAFDSDAFESHIELIQPKIVYLCNPNNPTGTLYTKEQIEGLVKRFNDVLFVVDEAYYEFSKVSACDLVSDYENIIICRTFSKAFALASFRIGYAISSSHNISGLRKIRNAKNITSYSQIAAIEALKDFEYTARYVGEVLASKKKFINNLNDIGIKVVGSASGNFVLLELGDVQERLINGLEKKGIYVRNYGHVEGMGGYTRITIGTERQMSRVLSEIASIIN